MPEETDKRMIDPLFATLCQPEPRWATPMKAVQRPWQFSLSAVVLCFVLVAVAMFGGMLGVASGLQQSIVELSPANFRFALVSGLVCGIVPAAIIGGILHWTCRKPIATFLVSACTALIVPAVFLNVITAMIAAV